MANVSAIDTLAASFWLVGHHAVEGVSCGGQISTHIWLKKNPNTLHSGGGSRSSQRAHTHTHMHVCTNTHTSTRWEDTWRWSPSKPRTPTGGQRWPVGRAARTSCGWWLCGTKCKLSFRTQSWLVGAPLCDWVMTDLLDSWMRAMAMRILVRRKMRVRRRKASTTDRMITEDTQKSKYKFKQTNVLSNTQFVLLHNKSY